ncbi:hypothetical protein PGB90_006380 [Kerria lacca]
MQVLQNYIAMFCRPESDCSKISGTPFGGGEVSIFSIASCSLFFRSMIDGASEDNMVRCIFFCATISASRCRSFP